MARRKASRPALVPEAGYDDLIDQITVLLEQSRRGAARAVNRILTATYWQVGRYLVEFEQGGQARAEYGEGLLKRLAEDLTARHGRGFSRRTSGNCEPSSSAGRFARHRLTFSRQGRSSLTPWNPRLR